MRKSGILMHISSLPGPYERSTSRLYIREGNGTPLQYSFLENPMDGGAWWAVVHGVDRVGHD